MRDVDGQRRLECRHLVEIEDETRRELRGARRQVCVGPVGALGPYRELEPEWPFLTEANGERTARLAVQQAVAVDLGVMLHQVPGTPRTECLLVRDRGERQPSLQMVANAIQVIVGEDRSRRAGFHVSHPATID